MQIAAKLQAFFEGGYNVLYARYKSRLSDSRPQTSATVEIALGGEVAVTEVDAANGIYKLTMPSFNVTVEATFTPITGIAITPGPSSPEEGNSAEWYDLH